MSARRADERATAPADTVMRCAEKETKRDGVDERAPVLREVQDVQKLEDNGTDFQQQGLPSILVSEG